MLLNCPTPEDMLAVSTRKLTNILNKASHGRLGREKAEELKAAARNNLWYRLCKNAFSFQIKQLMQQIVFLENQLSELEKQISNLLHETNQYIISVVSVTFSVQSSSARLVISTVLNALISLLHLQDLMLLSSNRVSFQALRTKTQSVAHLICEELFGSLHNVLPLSANLFYPNIINLSEPEASTI